MLIAFQTDFLFTGHVLIEHNNVPFINFDRAMTLFDHLTVILIIQYTSPPSHQLPYFLCWVFDSFPLKNNPYANIVLNPLIPNSRKISRHLHFCYLKKRFELRGKPSPFFGSDCWKVSFYCLEHFHICFWLASFFKKLLDFLLEKMRVLNSLSSNLEYWFHS